MLQLDLIGIGTGHLEHITLQAIRCLNRADLILLPDKGREKSRLLQVRKDLLAHVLQPPGPRMVEFVMPTRHQSQDYRESVDDWHKRVAKVWKETIHAHLGQTGRVSFLVWGDPSLYDSSIRLAGRLAQTTDIELNIIPGITSVQGLTAAFGIPLNPLAGSVQFITGRTLRHSEGVHISADTTTVVMLDGECSFSYLNDKQVYIWWGAYVGMPEQYLIHGVLAEVEQDIIRTRQELRAQHGWVMDIYMLSNSHEHKGIS